MMLAKTKALFLRLMLSFGPASKPSMPRHTHSLAGYCNSLRPPPPCSQEGFQSIVLHLRVAAYQDIFIISSNPLISSPFAFFHLQKLQHFPLSVNEEVLLIMCICFAKKQIGSKPNSVSIELLKTPVPHLRFGLLVKFTQLCS